MSSPQPGILVPVPSFSRYLEFGAVPDPDLVPVLRELASRSIDQELVVGVGPGLVQGLGKSIEGLHSLPPHRSLSKSQRPKGKSMPAHDRIQLEGKEFAHAMVDADGIRFHSVSGGEGPAVLLIAGFPQSWFAWRRVMPLLVDRFRVIALDLPGQGDSDKPVDGYDTETTGDRLHALVKALDLDSYFIGAHDIGAWVAYPYIARFPDEVRKLVILDANIPGVTLKSTIDVGPENWKSWHFFFHPVPDLPEILLTGRERQYIEWFFQRKTYNPAGTFSAVDIDEYERVYRQPGNLRGALAYYRAVFEDIEQNKPLANKKLDTPILALGGDVGMSPQIYEAMKPLGSDVQGGVIQNCGHYMPEEQPEIIAERMVEFFLKP